MHRALVAALGAGLLSIGFASPSYAAAGNLDPTFGGDGKVTTDFTNSYDAAYSIAIQDDGKLVVVGETASDQRSPEFAVARYNPDGSLDPSFSKNGKRRTDFTPHEDVPFGVAIQADGKIVVAGTAAYDRPTSKFALARYNADGSRDTSFSGDGKLMTAFTSRGDVGNALALQNDGKIVVVGDAGANGAHAKFAVARYDENGALDSTFGGDGKVRTDFTSYPEDALGVAITAQDKIVVAGGSGFDSPKERFALARYEADGSLDATFGGDGKVTTNVAKGPDVAFVVALQTNGKIVVAGGCSLGERNPKWALARYNQNGILDPSFNGDGKVITDFTPYDDGAYGMRIQTDGKIVAAGLAGNDGTGEGNFALARYDANGSLDSSLGGDGKVTTDFAKGFDSAWTVAIQPNGKIVAAGQAGRSDTNFALVRYLAG
jgi:uncharacterized delta-60 repeat protein